MVQPATAPIVLAGAASVARYAIGAVIAAKVSRCCIGLLSSEHRAPGGIALPVVVAVAVIADCVYCIPSLSDCGVHVMHGSESKCISSPFGCP
jgi:hypothetical protein